MVWTMMYKDNVKVAPAEAPPLYFPFPSNWLFHDVSKAIWVRYSCTSVSHLWLCLGSRMKSSESVEHLTCQDVEVQGFLEALFRLTVSDISVLPFFKNFLNPVSVLAHTCYYTIVTCELCPLWKKKVSFLFVLKAIIWQFHGVHAVLWDTVSECFLLIFPFSYMILWSDIFN